MAGIFIRKGQAQDGEQIHQIETQCFAFPWSTKSILEDICENPRAFYLVAVPSDDHDKILGYMGVWKILDEGHITNVAVAPWARRNHIGDQLVQSMIDELERENIFRMTLEVRRSNEAAIALYEKNGFEGVGYRKGYYEDNGEDALIMWRGPGEF